MIRESLERSFDNNKENELSIPKAEDLIGVLEKHGLEKHAEAYRKVVEIAEGIKEAGG